MTNTLAWALTAAVALTAGRPDVPAPSPAPRAALARGDVVSAFDAEGIDGTVKHVDFPKGTTTLLLFFLSGCPTCHRLIPEWNRAYERRPQNLRVLGVMMDREPPAFFLAHPVSFPVVRAPGTTVRDAFKIERVPLMVRVLAGGKVHDVGSGLLDPIRLGELFRP